MTVKVSFWSDSLGTVPKDTFQPLRAETIKKRMIAALEVHNGDGDIWAVRRDISRDHWEEETFCFVKVDGVISEEAVKE